MKANIFSLFVCSCFSCPSNFVVAIKCLSYRVNSGKFGHQVNSDTYLQTVEIQMSCSLCLVNLFFIPIIEVWNKQDRCPNLAVCPNIPDFTQMFQNKKNYEQKCRECDTAEESYNTMHQAVTYTKKEIEKVWQFLSHNNEILENINLIWASSLENLSSCICEQQKAQTSLRTCAVWSAPLLFAYWKELCLHLLQPKFQFFS